MDNNDRLYKIGIDLWYKFDEIMENEGYNVMTTNDKTMGRASIAYKDKFSPIIEFRYSFINVELLSGGFISILVLDRNGNSDIDGDMAAAYKLDVNDKDTDEDIRYRFNKMLDAVLNKYSGYNKQNRLDFVYNGLELDKKIF